MNNINSQILGSKNSVLGKHTKSQANLAQQGFQRLHEFILQDQSAKLLPQERVSNCLKRRIDKKKNRTVMFNESRQNAHWGNVQRCGSIWSCPVCAKKITESRRSDLNKLLGYWKQQENSDIKLMTLTFSHSPNESLSSLMQRLKHAMTRFFGHRKFKELSAICKIKHKVRSLEITRGSNGWHPHFHILLLTNDTENLAFSFRDELAQLWISCCEMSGLSSPSIEHGLDIRDGSFAQEYIAKWGIDYEMTKGHVKRGRKNSLTPFDLLQKSFEDEDYFFRKPSKLFQEFAISMKGARQLVWSRGLKKLIGLDEKTDQEIVDETDLDSITLRQVDQIVFDLLTRYKKRHDFLQWQKNDFLNGCYGAGETEHNLINLFENYISDLPEGESDYLHFCQSLV